MGSSGPSSGGWFAFGNYVSSNVRLDLHYRHWLGLVTYHFGAMSLEHESYVKAVLGSEGGNRYPGFTDEQLAACDGLKFDLEHFASAFLLGNHEEFVRCARIASESKRTTGFARLP